MEPRPWHRHYDPDVPRSIEYPEVPLQRFLDDSAAKFPDRIAIAFLGRHIAYSELKDQCDAFAQGLHDLGVKRGDRVALYLPNVPHMIIGYYGALKAGAVCVPTNPMYTERELGHQVKDSGARVLVTLDLALTLAKVKAVQEESGLERVIVGSVSDFLPFPKSLLYPLVKGGELEEVPRGGGYARFRDLLKKKESPVNLPVAVPGDDAVLMYTGGTTGVSKGAILTHRNLVANAIQTCRWESTGDEAGEPQPSIMTILPLFHSFSMTVCMNHGIMRGAKLILFPARPRPDLSDLLTMIRDEQPTYMPGVPLLYTAMANNPKVRGYGVECIKVCNSGAAPLPVEVLQKFEAVTGAKIIEGYGLSESSPVATCNPVEGVRKVGSVGLPMPDTEIRIVDQSDGVTDMQAGERGEVLIRGPQVMRGYWNRPEETENALKDGWLYTGDIGTLDEDGYLTIVDRKKDMIITGGFNIYPREVEEVLYEHPQVLEAAVIGVADERSGERLKAYIVLKSGEEATAEEMLAYCRGKLTAYKVPRSVEFRRELPKNNVGKLMRRLLRDEELRHRLREGDPEAGPPR